MPTPLDRTEDVLTVLEKQGAPSLAIDVARGHVALETNIRTAEYTPQREARELDALRSTTIAQLRDAETEALAAIDAEEADAVTADDNERAARVREGRRLSDVVDLATLRAPDTPIAEILRIVEDADRFGLAAQARDIAIPPLRKRAGDELRRHVFPQRGTAGAALAILTASQPSAGSRDVRAPFEAKRRRVREFVMEVARVLGLAEQMKRAAVSTALPDAPTTKATMTIGSFWDRYPQLRNRN